jgi:hypothetical protein
MEIGVQRDYLHRSPNTRNFRYGEILWPRQRRGTRPCRWARPGCWRRSWRGRCRGCCSGAGCWRGGRRGSSSGRRRRCTSSHRSKNIDTTPTIDVVWRARGSALSRIDMDSRVIQGIAARGKLVSQAGNSRPQQSHCARDVRRGHGCAAEIRV